MATGKDAPFWGPWGQKLHAACEREGWPGFARAEPIKDERGGTLPGLGYFCFRQRGPAAANEGPVSALVEMHAREDLFAHAARFGMRPSEFLATTEVLHG